MQLAELLRKSSEHTLVDMVQLLFSRLPQFKEDPKWATSVRKVCYKCCPFLANPVKSGSGKIFGGIELHFMDFSTAAVLVKRLKVKAL